MTAEPVAWQRKVKANKNADWKWVQISENDVEFWEDKGFEVRALALATPVSAESVAIAPLDTSTSQETKDALAGIDSNIRNAAREARNILVGGALATPVPPISQTTVGKTQAIDPHKDAGCGAERREEVPTVAPSAMQAAFDEMLAALEGILACVGKREVRAAEAAVARANAIKGGEGS